MKVLLTGATGFVGNNLVKSKNFNFRCVTRDSKKHSFRDFFKIKDLNERTSWKGAFEGVDAVVHLAGLSHSDGCDEALYEQINFKGTLKLAKESENAGVKKFIFISTALVNGEVTTHGCPFNENSPVNPINEYAKSKYAAELELKELSARTNMKVVIVRPPIVYGCGVKANFLTLFNLVKKMPILPFYLAKNSRSFISVDNLVSFIELCLVHEKANNQVFLISDNESISTRVLTNRIAKVFGKNIKQLPVPVFLFKFLGIILKKNRIVEQLFGDFEIDCSKAVNQLNWKPKISMHETLLKLSTGDYYKDA